jgi:uncharacterized membrane protein
MDEIFGVPAHPLFVHAPLVLTPILALWAMGMVLRPAWRRHAWWLFGATLVVFIATVLATQSGEELYERLESGIGKIADEHQELGEATRLILFIQTLVTFVFALVRSRVAKAADTATSSLRSAATLLISLTAVFGILSTIWMIRTGHEGAEITWQLPDK